VLGHGHTLPAYSPYCLDWLCSARLAITKQASGGVELGLLQGQLATKQWAAATEVRLVDEHEGTNTIATIAVELGFPDCVTVLPARAKFPAPWSRKRRAQNLWDLEDRAACVDSTLPIT